MGRWEGAGAAPNHPPPSMGSHHTETRGPGIDASPSLCKYGGFHLKSHLMAEAVRFAQGVTAQRGTSAPSAAPIEPNPSPGHGDPQNPPALILSTVLSAGFGIPLHLPCSLGKETQLCHSPLDTELGMVGTAHFTKL